MKYYTLDNIMELKPCHSRDKLEVYMEGRKRISLSGLLNSKASDDDKVWLVVRLIPVDKTIKFAQWCADSVRHINNDKAASAASAAWGVGCAAFGRAARAASWAAAYTAAYAAADAQAAYDAYARGVYDKARKNQINQLKSIVKENNL